MTELTNARYFESLERTGITQHPGGLEATRRLAERIGVGPGQRVLDIGCGTGYTACSLAKKYRANVVAVDLRTRMLEWARQRVGKEGLGERVTLIEANAHALPVPPRTFDAVLAESVLVFCSQKRAAFEMHRVLKPGGHFGSNEITALKPLPARFQEIPESTSMDVNFLNEQGWRAVFAEAGFLDVTFATGSIRLLETSLLTPLRMDGARKYVSPILRNIADPTLRSSATGRLRGR